MTPGLMERSMRELVKQADDAISQRDELLEIVRALADVYTLNTDQIAVLTLVARARMAVDKIDPRAAIAKVEGK